MIHRRDYVHAVMQHPKKDARIEFELVFRWGKPDRKASYGVRVEGERRIPLTHKELLSAYVSRVVQRAAVLLPSDQREFEIVQEFV